MKKNYSSTAGISNWNKLFGGILSSLFGNFIFSFFVVVVVFFPLFFHRGRLEHVSPVTHPHGRGGCLSCVECTRPSGVPPQRRLPFWGTIDPRANFAQGKTALPRAGARNHARVEQVVLFQVDREHHQEFRQSSFPFLERSCTGSPSDFKRFPSTGEKPQDPWGPSWPGLGSSMEESRPYLEHRKTPESNWRL